MSSIIFTGATGFLGSEVAARMVKSRLERGRSLDDLVFLGRRRPETMRSLLALRFAEHGLEPTLIGKLRFVETDFLDAARFRASLDKLGSDASGAVVLHMAAIIHRTGSMDEQTRVNIGVTDDLVDWCNEHGSKFVFMSSVVSFGGAETPTLRSESDFSTEAGPGHRFDYFRTKHEAHVRVLERSRKPAVLLCPSIVHGSLEGFKNSRSHLKALREGRLNLAPSGGGNFVGLDRVAQAIVDACERPAPERHETRLLIDQNLSYRDYFELYVRLARGPKAQAIRAVPRWAGLAARAAQAILDRAGRTVGAVEGLARGSYWLHFKSEHELPPTAGLEAALRAALDSPGSDE